MRLNCFMGERGINPKRDALRADYPEHHRAPKACSVCGGKPCLRVVGKLGFCENHVAEAFSAAKKATVAA